MSTKTFSPADIVAILRERDIAPDETFTAAAGADYGNVEAWDIGQRGYVIAYGDNADACALLADVQRAIDDHDDLPDDPTRYTRAAVAYGAQLRKDEARPDHWVCTMPNGDNCTGATREAAAEIMCRRHGLA